MSGVSLGAWVDGWKRSAPFGDSETRQIRAFRTAFNHTAKMRGMFFCCSNPAKTGISVTAESRYLQ
jgi:hypothetical protein